MRTEDGIEDHRHQNKQQKKAKKKRTNNKKRREQQGMTFYARKCVQTNTSEGVKESGKKEESTMSKAATSDTGHNLRIYRTLKIASSNSDTVVASGVSTIVAAMVTLSQSAISCCSCCGF
jgi:hypothetical protein